MKKIGIIHHHRLPAAKTLTAELKEILISLNCEVWCFPTTEEEHISAVIPGTELTISIGGDGTILRTARAIAPWGIPILGINLGKLGFLTELNTSEARERIKEIIGGSGWVDERCMLRAQVAGIVYDTTRAVLLKPLDALNDVVVSRSSVTRIINVKTTVNGASLTTYKADGVIVSTATGSTGYCLAVAGPIVDPGMKVSIVKPIAAHLTMQSAVVMPISSVIEFEVNTDHQALLSIDGQLEFPLLNGDKVRITGSPYVVKFLRIHPRESFYSSLEKKLRGIGTC